MRVVSLDVHSVWRLPFELRTHSSDRIQNSGPLFLKRTYPDYVINQLESNDNYCIRTSFKIILDEKSGIKQGLQTTGKGLSHTC